MLRVRLDPHARWGEFRDPEEDRYCYNLQGPWKYIVPAAIAVGSLVVGPELLGALGAADVGAAAGAGAADAAAAGGAAAGADIATDAGLAAAVNAAPAITAGTTVLSDVATPLAAAAPAVAGLSTEAVTGLSDAVSGLGGAAGAAGAAGTAADAAGLGAPLAQAAAPNLTAPLSVEQAVAGPGAGDLGAATTGAPLAQAAGGAATTAAPVSAAPAIGGSGLGSAAGAAAPGGVVGAAPIAGDAVVGTETATPLAADSPLLGTDISGAGADFTGGAAAATGGSDTAGGIGSALKSALPFVSPAISALGLGYDYLKSKQPLPYQPQVATAAGNVATAADTIAGQGAQEVQKGNQLQTYINTGALPPGEAEALKSATSSADAAVKSRYAALGESGSSAEATDLQAVADNAAASRANLGLQLLQTGISETNSGISAEGQAVNATGLDASLYESLMNTALQQDSALGSAIGNFASSLVPRTNVNLTTQPTA